jgi:hypothetical protein
MIRVFLTDHRDEVSSAELMVSNSMASADTWLPGVARDT